MIAIDTQISSTASDTVICPFPDRYRTCVYAISLQEIKINICKAVQANDTWKDPLYREDAVKSILR